MAVPTYEAGQADLSLPAIVVGMQPDHKVTRVELTALVRVEDLWPADTFQCHLQGIETELGFKAVGELPAEHVSGQQIHDCYQVEEALLQRDVGPPEKDQTACTAVDLSSFRR